MNMIGGKLPVPRRQSLRRPRRRVVHDSWRIAFHAVWPLLMMGGLLGGLAGCRTTNWSGKPGSVYSCRGTVRVLRVDPWLESAVVRFDGRRITAWWNRSSVFFYQGSKTSTFMAKPGQRLYFDGLLTDGDLYFGRAWIGPAPPFFQGTRPLIERAPWPAGVPRPKAAGGHGVPRKLGS